MVECQDFEDTDCKLLLAKIGDKNEKVVCVPIEKEKFEIRRLDESCAYFIVDVEREDDYNYLFIAHVNKKDGEERKFILSLIHI